jgi:hypothetical protein
MAITNDQLKTMRRLAARKNVSSVGKPSWSFRAPYTIVTVQSNGKTGIGFSKCSPKDKWDKGIGFNIALSRALDDVAKNS